MFPHKLTAASPHSSCRSPTLSLTAAVQHGQSDPGEYSSQHTSWCVRTSLVYCRVVPLGPADISDNDSKIQPVKNSYTTQSLNTPDW